MRFIIADTFTKGLARLEARHQALVKQAAFDFQVDPSNPGFRFHRLERGVDQRFWSFRVNDDIRIIVHRSDADFVLCYADHHDQAYAWAEARKLERHPTTGAAQLVEVVTRREEIVEYAKRTLEPPVFGALDDDLLLQLGVPPDHLASVRSATLPNLEDVLGRLPAEAGERLLLIACGQAVEPPATSGALDSFDHPDAQRRFRVVREDDLVRALDAPWHQWVIFLHPAQRSVVNRRYKGPARISGGAGTGKTVVALHRAARLARETGGRIFLGTFSRTLALRLEQQLDYLLPPSDPARRRICIAHIHRLARDLWKGVPGNAFAPATGADIREALDAARLRLGIEHSSAFLRHEWEGVVDPLHLRTWQEYRNVDRTGRTTPLTKSERAELWRVFVDLWEQLEQRGLMTWNQLCHGAAATVRDAPPFQHAVVDESQDLGPAEMTLVRALVKPGPDDLFFCGDAGQRIYRSAFPWSSCGVDVRGRSSRLRLNYRTTEQIRRAADSMMPGALDEGDGTAEARATISMLSGPEPEVREVRDAADECATLARILATFTSGGIDPGQIGLFARTEATVRERIEPAVRAAGLEFQRLTDDAPTSGTKVAIGTMHRTKGLEFRAVIVVGAEDTCVPSPRALQEAGSEEERSEVVERERHLLYVAMTRAREDLVVLHLGPPSRFLKQG